MIPPRDPSQIERYTQTKRDGKKYFMQMERKKKSWCSSRAAVLITDKIDFKTKGIVREKEGHYIMIKGTKQQEVVTQ